MISKIPPLVEAIDVVSLKGDRAKLLVQLIEDYSSTVLGGTGFQNPFVTRFSPEPLNIGQVKCRLRKDSDKRTDPVIYKYFQFDAELIYKGDKATSNWLDCAGFDQIDLESLIPTPERGTIYEGPLPAMRGYMRRTLGGVGSWALNDNKIG